MYKCVVHFMRRYEQNPWTESPELLFGDIPPVMSLSSPDGGTAISVG